MPHALMKKLGVPGDSIIQMPQTARWMSRSPKQKGSTRPSEATPGDVPESFTELPAPPEVRTGAVTAWTGSEVLVWGGYVYDGTNYWGDR
jgi:hypothetical protein